MEALEAGVTARSIHSALSRGPRGSHAVFERKRFPEVEI